MQNAVVGENLISLDMLKRHLSLKAGKTIIRGKFFANYSP